ncbi:cereblon family protein [Endozoicomonadaceae bacterium StTr2]
MSVLFLRHPANETPVSAPQQHSSTSSETIIGRSEEWLLCRHCEAKITSSQQRIVVQDSHLHTQCNPGGYLFHFGCFEIAPGCRLAAPVSREFSWFAGYSWQPALCNQCQNHLGWHFSKADPAHAFYGLILSRLATEAS